ncbi:hypothetical protein B0T17DRAFT_405074 [Bombardia bombarda]|uniref:Uncharacterized protein n=1 Tax=Bombardia bombarda TaxID=252184 RepID=A0AA39U6Z7_9PEZI|nr:hypothetical protein B0T17DRAFT_405074 [Bombardia bombarda]
MATDARSTRDPPPPYSRRPERVGTPPPHINSPRPQRRVSFAPIERADQDRSGQSPPTPPPRSVSVCSTLTINNYFFNPWDHHPPPRRRSTSESFNPTFNLEYLGSLPDLDRSASNPPAFNPPAFNPPTFNPPAFSPPITDPRYNSPLYNPPSGAFQPRPPYTTWQGPVTYRPNPVCHSPPSGPVYTYQPPAGVSYAPPPEPSEDDDGDDESDTPDLPNGYYRAHHPGFGNMIGIPYCPQPRRYSYSM